MVFEVRLLGTFDVRRDGSAVGPAPEAVKPRTLLALLAIHANHVLSKGMLVDRMWADPPTSARNLVEKYVSLWRKVLDADRLETIGRGYRLRLTPEETDLGRFRAALDEGRSLTAAGRLTDAAEVLDRAMRMWQSWDVRSFANDLLLPSDEAQLLVDLQLQGLEEWATAALTTGVGDVREHVRRVVEHHPYHERLAELLMWAYARHGDHAGAVEIYQRTRTLLADDLGQDPGDALRRMHARIVRRDPSLIGGVPPARAHVPIQGGAAGLRGGATAPDRTKVSNLPARWQSFTGRAQELRHLESLLLPRSERPEERPSPEPGARPSSEAEQAREAEAAPVRGVSVCGGVGMGKTALALEFGRRHADDFQVIWVIDASSRDSLVDGLDALGRRLGLAPSAEPEPDLTPLWEHLRRHRWLLVLDNAGHPAVLEGYWPPSENGTLIVTSPDPDWGRHLRILELATLSGPETRELLRARGVSGPDACMDDLVDALDGLPLACEQAAAYMRQTTMPADRYLTLFRARRRELLERGVPDDHRGTIAATWRLAVAQLTPTAVHLALLFAAMAPQTVPLDLLVADPEALPEPLAGAVRDGLQLEDAIRELRRFSLLGRDGRGLRMHRLVQAVIAGAGDPEDARAWQVRAGRLLIAAAPGPDAGASAWPVWHTLVPHVMALAERSDVRDTSRPQVIDLLHRASDYLVARGSFDDAHALLERTLTIIETGSGGTGPDGTGSDGTRPGARSRRPVHGGGADLGRTWTQLGDLMIKVGRPRLAVDAYETALDVLRQQLPDDHPSVARSVAGLTLALTCHDGVSLWKSDELPAAQERFVAVLAVLEEAFGPDHPVVAAAVSGLGQVLQDRGDLDRAVACQEDALRILRAAYGPDHPDVGYAHGKLGFALALRRDFVRARRCEEESLRILAAAFGAGHPQTGWPLSNLGVCLLEAGEIEEAVDFQLRAREVFGATPGNETAVLITSWRLGRAQLRAGRTAEAVRLLGEAVPRLAETLGEGHADVTAARHDLDRALRTARSERNAPTG